MKLEDLRLNQNVCIVHNDCIFFNTRIVGLRHEYKCSNYTIQICTCGGYKVEFDIKEGEDLPSMVNASDDTYKYFVFNKEGKDEIYKQELERIEEFKKMEWHLCE